MDSLKAKNIQRGNRVSICLDDRITAFSFATIFGIARTYQYNQTTLLSELPKIAERYMGKDRAKAYGKRNSGNEVVIRIEHTKILAEKDIAN